MVQMQQSRLWVGCAGREQQAAGCHRVRMGRQHSSGGAPVMPAGGAAERLAARRVAGRAAGRAAATAATAVAAAGLTAAASASAGRTFDVPAAVEGATIVGSSLLLLLLLLAWEQLLHWRGSGRELQLSWLS